MIAKQIFSNMMLFAPQKDVWWTSGAQNERPSNFFSPVYIMITFKCINKVSEEIQI